MLKAQKVKYAEEMTKKANSYSVAGVMSIDAVPDRLIQRIRNELKPDTLMVTGRRSILMRITASDKLKALQPYITGSVALLFSNKEPMELYGVVSSNKLRLLAKPNQIAPTEIRIESGETSIAPGQAVTDLKTAGIDVQIQKGKVIISKGKVLVAKGAKISIPIAKALKMLDIMPFEAKGDLRAIVEGKLLFTEEVLKVSPEFVRGEIASSFLSAYQLSLAMGYVTQYNVSEFIRRAFTAALNIGVEAKIPEGEAAERLLGIASLQANSLNAMVKVEQPSKTEEAKAEEPKPDEKKAEEVK